jgi:hypothetical protein
MRKEVSYETMIHQPLAPFYPAGIEPLRCNQTQSVSNVQPHYNAGDLPAKENKKVKKQLILTALIVLATVTLAACAPRTTSRALSPEEGAAYAAEVDDIVENMIVGFTENDFAKYTRDIKHPLDEAYEASIRQFADEIIVEWGAYQGKTLDHVEDRGRSRVVIYHLVFEKEPDVTLSVTFKNAKSHLIVGTNWHSEVEAP